MQRARLVTIVVALGATFGAESWQPLEAQDPANCHLEEALHIPLGPDNLIEHDEGYI